MPLQSLRSNSTNPARGLCFAGLLVLPLVLAPGGPLRAQQTGDSTLTDQEEIRVEVTGTARPKLRLASPAMKRSPTADPTTSTVTDELEETLLNDLRWSGVFEVQGPEVLTVLNLTGERKHDFLQYQSLGNEVVLLSEVSYADNRVTLEGKVYDLQSGRFISASATPAPMTRTDALPIRSTTKWCAISPASPALPRPRSSSSRIATVSESKSST